MTTTMKTGANASLAERIAWASIEVGAFIPDKRNKEQNYDYISADAVLARGGHALAVNGVSVVPAITSVEISPTKYTTRSGNESTRYDARVVFNMLVTCGNEPADQMTIQWFGFGSDYAVPDKSAFKAITSGHKYFIMKLLNIGAGNEDGEHENPPAEPERVSSAAANAKRAAVVNTVTPGSSSTPPTPPTMAERADKNESTAIRAFINTSGAKPKEVEMFFGSATVNGVRAWAVKNRKTIAESLAAFGKFLKDVPPDIYKSTDTTDTTDTTATTDESEIPF